MIGSIFFMIAYTFAGNEGAYLEQTGCMTGWSSRKSFLAGDYRYTKPILYRNNPGGHDDASCDEIHYKGIAYDWERVRAKGGVRQYLYYADEAGALSFPQQRDLKLGRDWADKNLPLKKFGASEKGSTSHDQSVFGIKTEWASYIADSRQRLMAAYNEYARWGMKFENESEIVDAYKKYLNDSAWKLLKERNPKNRHSALVALTKRDADLSEMIDLLYEPLIDRKNREFSNWEKEHPEMAAAIMEKKRAAANAEEIRKMKKRVAKAEADREARDLEKLSLQHAAQRAEENREGLNGVAAQQQQFRNDAVASKAFWQVQKQVKKGQRRPLTTEEFNRLATPAVAE